MFKSRPVFNLGNSEMDKDIKKLLWPHKNSGYLGSHGFGFIRISWSIFELECFEKMFPKIKISALLEIVNFQHIFNFSKNAQEIE